MTTNTASYQDRIVRDPEVMVGKPVVKGTRIPVSTVLDHLAADPNLDELFAAYPRLTIDDVKAVLAYARDRVDSPSRRKTRSLPRPAVPARA
jgi:uncharacterized protein (DUF433 family)